jgi:CDGSH-type Zn-finger protein
VTKPKEFSYIFADRHRPIDIVAKVPTVSRAYTCACGAVRNFPFVPGDHDCVDGTPTHNPARHYGEHEDE